MVTTHETSAETREVASAEGMIAPPTDDTAAKTISPSALHHAANCFIMDQSLHISAPNAIFSLALADLDRIRDADPRLLTPADLEPLVDAGILQDPITDATILPSSRDLALYVNPTTLRDHARSIHRYNDVDSTARQSRSNTYYDGRTDANGKALITTDAKRPVRPFCRADILPLARHPRWTSLARYVILLRANAISWMRSCPHCGTAPESLTHLLCHCRHPAIAFSRNNLFAATKIAPAFIECLPFNEPPTPLILKRRRQLEDFTRALLLCGKPVRRHSEAIPEEHRAPWDDDFVTAPVDAFLRTVFALRERALRSDTTYAERQTRWHYPAFSTDPNASWPPMRFDAPDA